MARFQTIHSDIFLKKGIPVSLFDSIICVINCRMESKRFRMIFDITFLQNGHLHGRGILTVRRTPIRVFELGVFQSKGFGLLVHL